MNVVGLDLSLTSTGVAYADGTTTTHKPPNGMTGMLRLDWIRETVYFDTGYAVSTDLIAIEGYAYGRTNQAHQMGELGGVIRHSLWSHGVPYTDIAPSVLKKYATGKGNAGKDLVLVEAVKRLGYDGSSNDEADALWLRALVLDALGEPVVAVPAAHREALAKVTIPDGVL